MDIFIKGNFPSFKNSKQYFGKGRVIMSKTVLKYLKEFEYQWKSVPLQFANPEYPIKVGCNKHRLIFNKYIVIKNEGCFHTF